RAGDEDRHFNALHLRRTTLSFERGRKFRFNAVVERLLRHIRRARTRYPDEGGEQGKVLIVQHAIVDGEGAAKFGEIRVLRAAGLPAGRRGGQHRAGKLREIDTLDLAIGEFHAAITIERRHHVPLRTASGCNGKVNRRVPLKPLEIYRLGEERLGGKTGELEIRTDLRCGARTVYRQCARACALIEIEL